MSDSQVANEVPARPAWLGEDLYPFEGLYVDVDGSRVHYLDEGEGPVLLLMHGNPTWSFLYRNIIRGLSDRYRCIAIDYPGFGLSTARAGYTFMPGEHAAVVEQILLRLDLSDVTMMVQDWGGPIGFTVATRQPERFSAFVVGNTWAWPHANIRMAAFSRMLKNPVGKSLILHRNLFVERVMPTGVKRGKLPEKVKDAYRGPFPTPESRIPTYVFPREILESRATFLAEVERGLSKLKDRPALLVWPTGDIAFQEDERKRWESVFPDHRTVILEGAGHYIQEDAPDEIVSAIREWSDARGV